MRRRGALRRLGRGDRPRPDRDLDREPVVERGLERIRVERRRLAGRRRAAERPVGRQRQRDHRTEHRLRRECAAAGPPASRAPRPAPAGLDRQRVVPGHDRRPAAVDEPADELERRRDREPGGRVERALPVELAAGTARPRASGGVRAVRDRRRPDARLAVAPDVEERRALRRADPLVEVARVVRRAERVEVERHHPRRVRAVDERVDPARRRGPRRSARSAGRAPSGS